MGGNQGRTATVLFVDDEQWDCFNQLAAVLRRHGVDPVRVRTTAASRGRVVAMLDRGVYRGVVTLDASGRTSELHDLVAGGVVLDVQMSERTLLRIPPGTPDAALLETASGIAAARRARLVDKLALAQWLREAGVPVPEHISAKEMGAGGAVDRLGLPLVVKRRTGTGGLEVRIAATVPAVETAVRELGANPDELFFQQFIDGDRLGYGAAVYRGVPLQECAALEMPARADPLGPTAYLRSIDAPELVEMGRRVVEVLGCERLVSMEFMRDREGRIWFVDLSTRSWGSFLAWRGAGLDLTEGYRFALGIAEASPVVRRPRGDALLPVFPTAVRDVLQRVGALRSSATIARALCPHLRRTGLRYCGFTGLILATEHARRLRAPLHATPDDHHVGAPAPNSFSERSTT